MAEGFGIKKLTEKSWVLQQGGTTVGFVHMTEEEKFALLTSEESTVYDSLELLKEHIGGKVSELISSESEDVDSDIKDHIDGFPVKHAKITIQQGGDRPMYFRGKTQHVAGYWCIKFSKRFVPSFCPLMKTVEQYESTGPYKSRFEMMANLATLNR